MSGTDALDKFLSRWSRRKIKARGGDDAPGGEPGPASPPVTSAPAAPHPGICDSAAPGSPGAQLPPIAELRGLESEYRDFLQPEVSESLRRSALKKLFQDPHFNVMDGLDTYIDDYTKPDPIPEVMLRGLNQAQGLIFDREDGRGSGDQPPRAVDAADGPMPVAGVGAEEAAEPSSTDAAVTDETGRSRSGSDTPQAAT